MNIGKASKPAIFFAIIYALIAQSSCGTSSSISTPTPTQSEPEATTSIATLKTSRPPLPTPQPTTTPGHAYPSLPTRPNSSDPEDFQLITPGAWDLLRLHEFGGEQANYAYEMYDYDDEIQEILLSDASTLGRVIDFELQRYYPDGVSDPMQILEEYDQEPFRTIPYILLDVLEKGVLEYIKMNDVNLTNGETINGPSFKAEVYRIELDYDSGSEWLLYVTSDWYTMNYITLNQNEPGIYEILPSELPNVLLYSLHDNYSILGTDDVTRDGLSDVIVDFSTYFWGTSSGKFLIFSGNKSGFRQISEIPWRTFDEAYVKSSMVIPPDGSLPYLQLDFPQNINWGCRWTKSDVYRWPNGVEQLKTNGRYPPNSSECALAQAVSIMQPMDDQTAMGLLEKAVFLFHTTPEANIDLEVFARYRLAVLYAFYGHDYAARQQLEAILSYKGEGQSEAAETLSSEIASLIEQPNIYPVPLCDIVFTMVKEDKNTPDVWQDYANDTMAVHAYPAGFDPYPPAGCPLGKFLEQTLEKMDFDPRTSPESVFLNHGMEVIASPMYLTDAEIPIWFVHIDLGSPVIAAYALQGGAYQWEILSQIGSTILSPLQHIYEDITGDGSVELAYAYEVEPAWWTGCSTGNRLYQSFVTTMVYEGLSVSIANSICLDEKETFDLYEYLADKDGDGLVDIALEYANQTQEDAEIDLFDLNEPWVTTSAISDYLHGITTNEVDETNESEIYISVTRLLFDEETRAQARPWLLNAREELDEHSPGYDYLWQQYTYLIGLSYELEDNHTEAIRYYLEVWRADVHTLWGNLVALKLNAK